MDNQRAMARSAWTGSGDRAAGAEFLALRERLGKTDFVGYDGVEAIGEVIALVREAGELDEATAGHTVEVVSRLRARRSG